MPRQKPTPGRLDENRRRQQNWSMGDPEDDIRAAPMFVFDDDDDYNSEEDGVSAMPFSGMLLIPENIAYQYQSSQISLY